MCYCNIWCPRLIAALVTSKQEKSVEIVWFNTMAIFPLKSKFCLCIASPEMSSIIQLFLHNFPKFIFSFTLHTFWPQVNWLLIDSGWRRVLQMLTEFKCFVLGLRCLFCNSCLSHGENAMIRASCEKPLAKQNLSFEVLPVCKHHTCFSIRQTQP